MENIEAENLVDTYNKEAPIHLLLDNSKEEKLDTTRAILKKISQGKKYLLDFIMLNSLTQKNCSVLQLAMDNEYLNIVDMILKDYYPKNFCADINGNCPMHLAACTGNIELLEILVVGFLVLFEDLKNLKFSLVYFTGQKQRHNLCWQQKWRYASSSSRHKQQTKIYHKFSEVRSRFYLQK